MIEINLCDRQAKRRLIQRVYLGRSPEQREARRVRNRDRYYKNEKYRGANRQRRRKLHCDSRRYRATELFNNARWRSFKKGTPFSLDVNEIQEILEKGVCQVTGLPFVFDARGRSPWAPTLDRIDSSKGYTKENTRVVVLIYNTAKQEFSHEDVLVLASAVLKERVCR